MMPERVKQGWRNWRFDQMAVMVNDRIDDPSEANVEHYVGLEHLDSYSLTIRRWGSPSDVEATKLRFSAGDIIFGRRRVYQRKLGVAHFDGICSAHAMVLRAKPEICLPEFLPFFMQSDLFMERAKQISVGSLSPTINWKTLAKENFALPPLDEQRRTADLIAQCQIMVDRLRHASLCYRSVKLSVLRSALAEAEADRSAAKVSIDNLGVPNESVLKTGPFGSKLKTDYFKKSGRPVITIGSITDEGLDGRGFFFLDLARVPEFADYETRPGDIVFSRVADVGRCHLIKNAEQGFIVSSNLIRIRINPNVVRPAFLWLLLKFSCRTRADIGRLTSQAAGRLLVNTETMARLMFSLPAVDVQDRVIGHYREIETAGIDLANRTAKAVKLLTQMTEEVIGVGYN